MELLELYYDVLIKIFAEVEPEDLAALAQTSLGLCNFIRMNERLYKAHYLRNFVRRECACPDEIFINLDRMILAEDRQTRNRIGSWSYSDW